MPHVPPELLAHRQWLGQIGPVGLVVSPAVLVKRGVVIDRQRALDVQTKLAELVKDGDSASVPEALTFFRDVLGWRPDCLAGVPGGPEISDTLVSALPEHEDHLRPTFAVLDPEEDSAWLLLVQVVAADDLDRVATHEKERGGWRASPHARLERLLRDTGVPIGLLFNGTSLRLVYAPKGESSGHLTFRFRYLLETQGRPMAGALHALLADERISDLLPEPQRLPALLKESRKYQNEVSTALADQVLEALWELVRGFQSANEASKGRLLEQALREAPQEVYGGFLATLMRLVFILYAEDRGLIPAGDVYQRSYAVAGLFERLREDEARYPDTMDSRYGAWAQLLALFRLIHDGGSHGALKFTARHGRLFDPDAYQFLEGRAHGSTRSKGERVDPPRVSDGVVYRVLRNLLILDGERLSYRALDVEQIGSVYEAMMGFALEQAHGLSVAVAPKHIVVNVEKLLDQPGPERGKWLREQAELKLSPTDALATARTVDEVLAALGTRVSRYTPRVLQVGGLYLQPTEERRRSGSHYTPRSLTEPIVRTTFRPILDRLGERATPQQILDLKICDPAMGSGAFLVEACRLLADRLVKAWAIHGRTGAMPPDEDELTLARRLVAERCLYGVDKNIFAVDLAKLSLWLATLAREHPFTFLDHALRHGDSLVGLSREQIACFNWDVESQLPLIRGLIDARVSEAQHLREQIQGLATSDDVQHKAALLREAEDALSGVRLIGDVIVSSFFDRDKPKDRKVLRQEYGGLVQQWLASGADRRQDFEVKTRLEGIADGLREHEHPIPPFHWQIELPEVFTPPNGGFDVIVGNPPFLGGTMISTAFGSSYRDFIAANTSNAGGRCDLVAYFFRQTFNLLRSNGALGLIGTKTIAQGDTRRGGLAAVVADGGIIFNADTAMKWPGTAAVTVSVVHVAKGAHAGTVLLNGSRSQSINPFLLPSTSNAEPLGLEREVDYFLGSKIYGQGFLFDDADPDATPLSVMKAIARDEPKSSRVVREYIGGEEVNRNVPSRRWVIDFGEMSETDARAHQRLWDIVEKRVRTSRENAPAQVRLTPFWWFFNRRTEQYARARTLPRILARSAVSEHHVFRWFSPHVVFSHNVFVLIDASAAAFSALHSRVHEEWVNLTSSSLEDRQGYRPSDCLDTFPFPTDWRDNTGLELTGSTYSAFRDGLMVRLGEGLTETYNRFHDPQECDPDVLHLRELHDMMDRAVLEAYGWTDIRPTCKFLLDFEDDEDADGAASKRRKPYRYRWPDEIRDEVLGRLLALNAKRAKQEQLAGAAAPRPARRSKVRESKKRGGGLLESL